MNVMVNAPITAKSSTESTIVIDPVEKDGQNSFSSLLVEANNDYVSSENDHTGEETVVDDSLMEGNLFQEDIKDEDMSYGLNDSDKAETSLDISTVLTLLHDNQINVSVNDEILEEENKDVELDHSQSKEMENSTPHFQQIKDIASEVSVFLKAVAESLSTPTSKLVNRLLIIIEEWNSSKGHLTEEEVESVLKNELTEKESAIWKHLLNTIEKRNFFAQQNIYTSDSSINKSMVSQWLQNAIERYSDDVEEQPEPIIPTRYSQAVPLTEVQQYTIHVQQLDRVERVSDDLLSKFQTIVRESQFMKSSNGRNQLTITLQPENLGNMTVRFVQVDGEMAVKIIVSSQVAREMLESNIHQLKHMFSPHQVVIERNELISEDEFFYKESDEEKNENEHEETDEHLDDLNSQDDSDEDFQTWFQRFAEEELVSE
ncbi:flagellar hook-length control protein FliK [Pseudogracilibacillus sp. SE30717A]|uniref:flagellar hook-length control protein FliK n=1 Tax=Pseudogracilibacillus sp. SE30717A TaxID=3098293 RepID=UPI00300E22AF